jgi:hypothetical protein
LPDLGLIKKIERRIIPPGWRVTDFVDDRQFGTDFLN